MMNTRDYTAALQRVHTLRRGRYAMFSWKAIVQMVLGGHATCSDVERFTEDAIRFSPARQ